MSEPGPVEVASEITGDDILAAGVFEAKGAAADRALGGAVGTMVGGEAGDVGQFVGAVAGAAAGEHASSVGGVYEYCLAVSPTRVYVLVPAHPGNPLTQKGQIRHGELEVAHAFDRRHLEVNVKARMSVRTVVLKDLQTGEEVGFEGRRLGWSHSKEVVRALVAHEPPEEPDPPA